MKTTLNQSFLVTIICLFLLSETSAQAPWTRLTPKPVENSIKDMTRIPGTNRLIGVTDGSTIITSDNQGETWDMIFNPAGIHNYCPLSDVYFIDDQTGFIGAGGQSILKTVDGGANWSLKFKAQESFNGDDITDIAFMNDTTGFALGEFDQIFKTTDRGETWMQTDTFQYATKFIKTSESIAYITNYIPGFWKKTMDGGNTWITENRPFGNQGEFITDLYFINDTIAIASLETTGYGNSTLYRTTNAGETWTQVFSPPFNLSVNEFNFIDELHGIALCWSLYYSTGILLTNDGGVSWSVIDEELPCQYLHTTCYYDENVLFTAGGYGYIYKSTDGGITWDEHSEHQLGGQIHEVQFINMDTGFLTCNSIGGGAISENFYKTTDGGVSWNPLNLMEGTPSEFCFLSDSLGYLAHYSEFYKYNRGEMEFLNTGFSFEALEINFCDTLNGVIVGEGRVIKTTDGGNTWIDITPVDNPYISYTNIQFPFPQTIYVTTESEVYRSSDGGLTWQSDPIQLNYFIEEFLMINTDTAFIAAGNQILKSIDAMQTWFPTTINGVGEFSPKSFCFPTSTTGYAVGHGSYFNILKTTDCGNTWDTLVPQSTTPLTSIYFSDENNGLVFGDLGLVMRTQTGGAVSTHNIPLADDKSNLTVNPNPFRNEISLSFKQNPVFPLNVAITDISGKIIQSLTIEDSNQATISTQYLNRGVYIVYVFDGDGFAEAKKVIKL